MDTAKYRQLLANFNGYVGISDAQSARTTERWLHSLDEILSSQPNRAALFDHTTRVNKSLSAITIISKERSSQADRAKAAEVLDSTAGELTKEMARLRSELQRINEVLEDRGLKSIIGDYLSSIEFVMDYIQLHFNGATLTTFTTPQLRDADHQLHFTDPGYRDTLCSYIGATVSDTEVKEDEFLRIIFADHREIRVTLKAEEAVGPEYAYFTSETGFSVSW